MPTPANEPEVQKQLYPVVGCDGAVSLTLNFGAPPFDPSPNPNPNPNPNPIAVDL